MNLDLNAGYDPKAQFKYNIHGFSSVQIDAQQRIAYLHDAVKTLFHAGHVIYTAGATDALRLVFHQAPDIFLFSDQHPRAEKFRNKAIPATENGVCLINYHQGKEEDYKKAIEKFQYIVLDFSQGIGKIPVPDKWDALLFSCSKIQGPFQTGFIITHEDSDIWEKVLCPYELIGEEKPDFKFVGSLNVDNCIRAFESVLESTVIDPHPVETKNGLLSVLKEFDEHVEILPSEMDNVVLFNLKHKWCPRSFQKLMYDNGVLIGFSSACQAGTTATLRLSFKDASPAGSAGVDMARFKAAFKASVEEMINAGPEAMVEEGDKLKGGKKSIKTVSLLSGEPHIRKEDEKKIIDMAAYKVHFEQININNYYMNAHWVPSHDAEPHISEKYAIMFQPELFISQYTVSLNIPPHHETHQTELKVLKQKASQEEEFDFENDVIRIQKRRLAKNLWINNPACEYQLKLEDFKTEKMKILLSDQVFRSVAHNMLMKKAYPKVFDVKVQEYEVEVKKYPEDLPQNIHVVYEGGTIVGRGNESTGTSEDTSEEQSEDESTDTSEDEGGVKEPRTLSGGRRDPDIIRKQIDFFATTANLRLLTQLGGNALSVAILHNLLRLYRRGEKPSKYFNPHQLVVLDERARNFTTYFGFPLTSINLQLNYIKTKTITPPKFYTEFDEVKGAMEKYTGGEGVYYCNLMSSQYEYLQEFLRKNKVSQAVLYLPYINDDEITQDFGLQHWLLEEGYDFTVVENGTYYDVWDMKFKQMTYVKFEKGLKAEGSHSEGTRLEGTHPEEVKTKALPQSKTEPREDGPHGAGKESENEDKDADEAEDTRSVSEDEDKDEDEEILAAMVAEMEEYVGGAPPVGQFMNMGKQFINNVRKSPQFKQMEQKLVKEVQNVGKEVANNLGQMAVQGVQAGVAAGATALMERVNRVVPPPQNAPQNAPQMSVAQAKAVLNQTFTPLKQELQNKVQETKQKVEEQIDKQVQKIQAVQEPVQNVEIKQTTEEVKEAVKEVKEEAQSKVLSKFAQQQIQEAIFALRAQDFTPEQIVEEIRRMVQPQTEAEK